MLFRRCGEREQKKRTQKKQFIVGGAGGRAVVRPKASPPRWQKKGEKPGSQQGVCRKRTREKRGGKRRKAIEQKVLSKTGKSLNGNQNQNGTPSSGREQDLESSPAR